jgi:UDP-N-acetylglucosamine--N-acetylmuramyl-(pentapeptide) pyrophosphoryl-undecaprenol N-acetylglucosamine transferase
VIILIAGGGTGGHLFPGVALAEAFRAREPGCEVVFAGARRGLEARLIPALGYRLVLLPLSGVMGKGLLARAAGILSLLAGTARMWARMGRERPALVVGLGGYASVPGVLAARLRGIPAVLLEQNVEAGAANRVLARIARTVYLGFPPAGRPFPPGKAEATGNPLRAAARAPEGTKPAAARVGDHPRTLLVLGGSQGARSLNDLALAAVPLLAAALPGLAVIHQTGAADEDRVRRAYDATAAAGTVEVRAFIERPGEVYARADLCLARAGALSVSELAAAGVPALYVPYPHAGSHQRGNARWARDRGAALVLEQEGLTPAGLAREIVRLLSDPAGLRAMAGAARAAGGADAAAEIARRELAIIAEGRRW